MITLHSVPDTLETVFKGRIPGTDHLFTVTLLAAFSPFADS